MSKHFFQNRWLREALLFSGRIYAKSQFWTTGPRIFINSIPKSGTHLVASELSMIPGLQNSFAHISRDVVESRINVEAKHGAPGPLQEIINSGYMQVRNGQFFTGHIPFSHQLHDDILATNVSHIFVIRHPLDVVVSHYHYISNLRRHKHHLHFTKTLRTDNDRIQFLLNGSDRPFHRSMRSRLREFEGWLTSSAVLVVRFEDLVGSAGGGTDDARHECRERIAAHVGIDFSHWPKSRNTRTSPTFRKGTINQWPAFFDTSKLRLLNDEDRRLIGKYGYDL